MRTEGTTVESISYFFSEEIADKSWMIKNVEHTPAICYLVEGKDYALLIDSIMGIGDLKEYCEALTSKPIKLVNTHAHPDHIGGNFHFDHCYIHHKDIAYFQTLLGPRKEECFEMARSMAPEEMRQHMVLDHNFKDWDPIRIYPLYDKDEFDLGDRIIEVVEAGGHTAGTIVLIDHKTRIAYSGDVCNSNTLLEFPNSLSVITYMKSLLRLKELQEEFDIMYGGHEIFDPTIIDEGIETAAKVIAGTDDKFQATGMMGTPVLYAAARNADGSRADGKRFNMSYDPAKRVKADEGNERI